MEWSLEIDHYLHRNRLRLCNDEADLVSPPSTTRPEPTSTARSPFCSPPATLLSWQRSPTSPAGRPLSSTRSPSLARTLSLDPEALLSPTRSPTLSCSPTPLRGVLQQIRNLENASAADDRHRGSCVDKPAGRNAVAAAHLEHRWGRCLIAWLPNTCAAGHQMFSQPIAH